MENDTNKQTNPFWILIIVIATKNIGSKRISGVVLSILLMRGS